MDLSCLRWMSNIGLMAVLGTITLKMLLFRL